MHTHRFSVIEKSTGLYWNGEVVPTFSKEPTYWCSRSDVLHRYSEYLRINAARVKISRPMHMKIISEKVAYELPTEDDLGPENIPTPAMVGSFERFFRNRVGEPSKKWAVAAFATKSRKKILKDLCALVKISGATKIEDTLGTIGIGESMFVHYYGDYVVGVTSPNDIFVLRSVFDVKQILDLQPYWDEFEQRFPGVRFSQSDSASN